MDTQHTVRVNRNLPSACIVVHDLKVDITLQGCPTPTFTVYRKENLNPIYLKRTCGKCPFSDHATIDRTFEGLKQSLDLRPTQTRRSKVKTTAWYKKM